jgi:hypothetical protein
LGLDLLNGKSSQIPVGSHLQFFSQPWLQLWTDILDYGQIVIFSVVPVHEHPLFVAATMNQSSLSQAKHNCT